MIVIHCLGSLKCAVWNLFPRAAWIMKIYFCIILLFSYHHEMFKGYHLFFFFILRLGWLWSEGQQTQNTSNMWNELWFYKRVYCIKGVYKAVFIKRYCDPVWYYCSDGSCKLASRSEKTEGARNTNVTFMCFALTKDPKYNFILSLPLHHHFCCQKCYFFFKFHLILICLIEDGFHSCVLLQFWKLFCGNLVWWYF